ncbi:hypothetical protein G6F42_026608 [Rhizopus arrhizus]|nr:hypothetical protein G6F42_026608 [Rhizopus arrhizus]
MMNNTEKRDIITKEFAGGRQDPIDETFGSDTGSFIGSDTGSASMIKTSLHLVLDLLLLKDCRPESKKQDKSLRTSTLMLLVQTMML